VGRFERRNEVKVRLFSCFAVAFLIPLTLSSQTQPQTTQVAEQPQVELSLLNSVTSTLTGTFVPATTLPDPANPGTNIAVPAACEFSITLPVGQQAIEARFTSDVSLDSTNQTCNAQFEIGEPQLGVAPSSAELANDANLTSASSTLTAPQTSTTTTAADIALVTTESAGFLKTWFIDSHNVVQNSDQNGTEWKWSGSGHCVTPVENTWAAKFARGWRLGFHEFDASFSCTETTSSSKVQFISTTFCSSGRTITSYNPNVVHGRENGDLTGEFAETASGPCASSLRRRVRIQRTKN
jgi:hypothetical protein